MINFYICSQLFMQPLKILRKKKSENTFWLKFIIASIKFIIAIQNQMTSNNNNKVKLSSWQFIQTSIHNLMLQVIIWLLWDYNCIWYSVLKLRNWSNEQTLSSSVISTFIKLIAKYSLYDFHYTIFISVFNSNSDHIIIWHE